MMPTYNGLEIKFTKVANKEMEYLELYVDDVLKVLERGKEQSRSKRKKGTIEHVLKIRKQTIKVVAVESLTYWNNEFVWLIIHVGDTSER